MKIFRNLEGQGMMEKVWRIDGKFLDKALMA